VNSNHHVTGAHTTDGTITGHSAINADGSMAAASIHTSGTGQFDTGVNVNGNTAISSSRAFSGASIHVSGAAQVDGNLSASNYQAGQPRPANTVGTFDATHFSTACSTINTIMNELADAGVMT
jgi:hypothetical protein